VPTATTDVFVRRAANNNSLSNPEVVMKVIAIPNATIALDGCAGAEGVVAKQNLPLTIVTLSTSPQR
jgi:hypothetical protein